MASDVVVEWEGFTDGLDAMDERINRALEQVVTKGGVIISNAAKRTFRGRPVGSQHTSKRTGRVYYTGKGDPPRPTNRSGNLSASIKVRDVRQIEPGVWQSKTYPTMKYAGYVEYGTSRAQAYPYMRPAIDEVTPMVQDLFYEAIATAQEA
jgi:HK97 gp10 family phage protein